MAKILFTGGGGAGNEAIQRLLDKHHDLFFCDADSSTINPSISQERRFEIPFANEPSFAQTVLDLARTRSIDIIVPGVDEELAALALHREGNPRVLVPQIDFVKTMLDKLTSADAIRDHNLHAPETRLLQQYEGMKFPLIAKPRSGRGSRGVMMLHEPSQIDGYLCLQNQSPDTFVAQEICEGQEYTVFVCADENASLQAVVPVKVDVKKGITIAASSEYSQPIFDYVVAFQKAFQPKGIYNIQCSLDANGSVKPFEVNPRVSTTFCLALATGFDPFKMPSDDRVIHVPKGIIKLRRHWWNEIEISTPVFGTEE